MDNLLIAFPEKTVEERIAIAKGFYHKLFDSMLESLKLLSAPDSFFEKRFTGNWDVVEKYYQQGRSVQLHLGHNFNWEWGNMMIAHTISYQFLGVYMPIVNKSFDRLFKKLRSRGGARLIDATRMSRGFLPYRNTQYCLGLIADQSPGSKSQWFDFFNRKTAFISGPTKMAITNNAVIIFASIQRPRRGHYQVTFSVAEENPGTKDEVVLTEQFVKYLENIIKANPDNWLWSHRRWKKEWKEEI